VNSGWSIVLPPFCVLSERVPQEVRIVPHKTHRRHGAPVKHHSLLGLLLASFLSSCAIPVHGIGTITTSGLKTMITSIEGRERTLKLDGANASMHYLNGHEVEFDGIWRGSSIDIGSWRVNQGINGLPAWVGEVRVVQGHVVMYVFADGIYVAFDEESEEVLEPHLGHIVLVEGYMQNNVGLRVVYYRPLYDEHGTSTP
jgi:hypothetical protein